MFLGHVCPLGEEVHARKWKLYAATQDSPLEEKRVGVGQFHRGDKTLSIPHNPNNCPHQKP
jgi:hypothetical protein